METFAATVELMASIGKYTLKDGAVRWRVMWRDDAGRQRTRRGFSRKTDAQRWWRSMERRGKPGARVTVAHAWEKAAEEASWKANTVEAFDGAWRSHVEPRWGRVDVVDVTPSTIHDWLRQLAADGLGPSRVGNCRSVLSAALAWSVREGVIAASPMQQVRNPRRVRAADADTELRIPTDAAVAALIEAVKVAPRAGVGRARLLTLLASTGMRWGEAAALRMADVDGDRATVARSATWVRGGVRYERPKTGRVRRIALPEAARAVVDARAAEGAGGDELVAAGVGGVPQPRPGRSRWWAAAVAAVAAHGIDIPARLTPHDLRHYAATSMLRAGIPVTAVARQLGHATPKTTMDVYLGVTDDDLDDVASMG